MIGSALSYISQRVDAVISQADRKPATTKGQKRSVLVGGEPDEPISFPQDVVSILLLNLKEDREHRSLDCYRQHLTPQGNSQLVRTPADVRLILSVLFVARFTDVAAGWDQLGYIIRAFQDKPVLSPENDPSFPAPLGMLSAEMISQTFGDQKDIWNSLRVSQRPAVLYRFKLVTLSSSQEQAISRIEARQLVAHPR